MMLKGLLVLCIAFSPLLGNVCEESIKCNSANRETCRSAVESSLAGLQNFLKSNGGATESRSDHPIIKERKRKKALRTLRKKNKFKRIHDIFCQYYVISEQIWPKRDESREDALTNEGSWTRSMTLTIQKTVCALEMITDNPKKCSKSLRSPAHNISRDNVELKLHTMETELIDFVNETLSILRNTKPTHKTRKNQRRRGKGRRRRTQKRRKGMRKSRSKGRSRNRSRSRNKSSSGGKNSPNAASTHISTPNRIIPSAAAPKTTVRRKGRKKRRRSRSRKRTSLKSTTPNSSLRTSSTPLMA